MQIGIIGGAVLLRLLLEIDGCAHTQMLLRSLMTRTPSRMNRRFASEKRTCRDEFCLRLSLQLERQMHDPYEQKPEVPLVVSPFALISSTRKMLLTAA